MFSKTDLDKFLDSSDNEPYHCKESSFIDKGHGHILTGGLRISKGNKLHKLIFEGPKLRAKT